MIENIKENVRNARIQVCISAKEEEAYSTFVHKCDYSYYPLLSLIQKYLGEQYIINILGNLSGSVFSNEGDFLKQIGNYAAQMMIESSGDELNKLIQEIQLAYTLERSIPYNGGKIEIHKNYSLLVEEFNTDIMHFIPTNRREAIDVDTEIGYHFHHCITQSGRYKRTKILLTFDPKGNKHSSGDENLFWEYHGPYLIVDVPGKNKRKKIYKECNKVRIQKNQSEFRNPSRESKVFFPM